jgi:hypothetical protein
LTLSEGAHVDLRKRTRCGMHASRSRFVPSIASVWQRFDTLTATKSCMERKLRVKNRFSNRHEQTYCEHDQFTYHVLVRVAGWLVRLTFASMSIKIAGIQLVLINLHDTRCAQRGEVSQREAPPSSHCLGPFDAHFVRRTALWPEAPLVSR